MTVGSCDNTLDSQRSQESGYFAVRHGKNVNSCIFLFWSDCKPHVEGYEKSVYSTFDNLEDAAVYVTVTDNECDDDSSECSHSENDCDESLKEISSKGTKRKITLSSKSIDDDISVIPLFPRRKKRMKYPWGSTFQKGNPLIGPISSRFSPEFFPGSLNLQFTPDFTHSMLAAAENMSNTCQMQQNFGGTGLSFVPAGHDPDGENSSGKNNPTSGVNRKGSVSNLTQSNPSSTKASAANRNSSSNIDVSSKTAFSKIVRELIKYKRANGSIYIKDDTTNPEHKNLRSRLEQICQRNDENLLGDDKLSVLRVHDFHPNTWRQELKRMNSEPPEHWLEKFYELKKYKQVHGHFPISDVTEEEKTLGFWLQEQCTNINKNRFPYKQQALFNSIGFNSSEWTNLMKSPLDEEWLDMFFKFKEYYEKNGTFVVSAIDDEAINLIDWIRKQCANVKRKYMSERKKLLIVSTKFDPDQWLKDMKKQPSNDWLNKFKRLKDYRDANGTFVVDPKDKANEQLGNWIRNMYDGIRSKKVNKVKIDMLAKIGFHSEEWKKEMAKLEDTVRWERKLTELREFRAESGHCVIPKGHKLAPWVRDQKHDYKVLMEGKESKMTLARMQKMIEIGFAFQKLKPRPPSWQQRLKELKEFKAKYGHCDVRKDEKTGLGTWVINQRYKYNQFKKGQRLTNINDELLIELAELGFNFQVGKSPGNWDDWYQELVEYKAIHGHTKVPQKHPSLGRWVKQQRKYFQKWKNGKPSPLSAERLLKLNEIGFVFEVRVRSIGSRRKSAKIEEAEEVGENAASEEDAASEDESAG